LKSITAAMVQGNYYCRSRRPRADGAHQISGARGFALRGAAMVDSCPSFRSHLGHRAGSRCDFHQARAARSIP